MEDIIKKNIKEINDFQSEIFLTKLQDLHYNKLCLFFNSKNMVELQDKFKEYVYNSFLQEKKATIESDYNNYFKNDKEKFEYYLKLTYTEYLDFWKKKFYKLKG